MKLDSVRRLTGVICASVAIFASAAHAEKSVRVQQGLELLNRSGELRMITQRQLYGICKLAAGVRDAGQFTIDADAERFNATLNLAQFGDPSRDFPGVRAAGPKRELGRVSEMWQTYSIFGAYALRKVYFPMQYLEQAQITRGMMLNQLEDYVSAIVKTYGRGRLTPEEAATLNVIARMRMQATLIGVEHCMIATGMTMERKNANLTRALEGFALSLDDALYGNRELGVLPATGSVEGSLRCARRAFEGVSDLIEEHNGRFTGNTVREVVPHIDTLTMNVDEAVDHFIEQIVEVDTSESADCLLS